MNSVLLPALKSIYADFPAALLNDAAMIAAFILLGIGFYFFFEPGRRLSLRAALNHVVRRDLFRHRSSLVDILHFVLTTGFWLPLVSALVTVLLAINIRDVLAAHFGVRAALLQAGLTLGLIQFAVIFVCRDFGSYAGHWLLHKVPLLWSVHRAHHSAEVLTFFTSTRAHPLEALHMQAFVALSGGLGGGVFLYLTGTALQAPPVLLVVLAGIFFGTFGLAQHSHLPISYGSLNRVLMAPVLHQLHHSAEPRHRDRNLGANLSVFDWLFGTLYVPQERETWRLGLNESELGDNNPHKRLRDFYFEPARHVWRSLAR